jgi:predicted ATP-grasp superfamily ATP-dependent carboligase
MDDHRAHRILVTDVDTRGPVAALRGLARRGYATTGAAAVRPAAGHWSRSCGRRLHVPSPELDGSRPFVAAIAAELARERYLGVIPGSDASLRALSEHRDLLPDSQAWLPSAAGVARALDKRVVGHLAAAHGLAEPLTIEVAARAALAEAAAEVGWPVVIKPWTSAATGPRETATHARDLPELAALAERFGYPVLLQRSLDRARIVQVAGVTDGSRLRAIGVALTTSMWPDTIGNTRRAVTVARAEELAGPIEAIIGATGYRGIFELDLLETADGTLHAIDLNPRPYGHMALTLRAGANLAGIWADILAGLDPPFETTRAGVRYRWEEAELAVAIGHARRGALRSAAETLRWQPNTVLGLGELRDPGPLAARLIELGGRRLRRSRHDAGTSGV